MLLILLLPNLFMAQILMHQQEIIILIRQLYFEWMNCLLDNGGEDTITAVGQTDSVSIDLRNATLENSV